METFFQQAGFDIKFEWGLQGLHALMPVSDVIIIVDILSFSTCVDIATGRRAVVYPYKWKDETAKEYARSLGAELANFERRDDGGYSLSPASLIDIPANTRLVLPSPNGSAITLAAHDTFTICGSLRNAKAVAEYAMKKGKRITVIAAGEQWADMSLRPAIEDMIGAGAIIANLNGNRSPESDAALSLFSSVKGRLPQTIKQCSSGEELIERGFERDVEIACELNLSLNVPVLYEGAYRGMNG